MAVAAPIERAILGPSVVGQLTKERVKAIMKAFVKKKMAIKNSHTKGEMEILDNEYAASKAPSLTLQQAMALAKAQQAQPDSARPMKNQPNPEGIISEEKALFLAELSQAVRELNQVLKGQRPALDTDQLLEELSYPEPNPDDPQFLV